MTEASTDSSAGRILDEVKRLLAAVEAGGRAVLPGSDQELLQSIVEAAARIFGAAAASIALVDEQQKELVFKVSYGAGNESVVGMHIPLDKGIAGYVAMTGQPIVTSNLQQDARFNQSFAQTTGYVPRSILAMPLIAEGGERVIGVMEVLDKISAPTFGLQDMELLGLFARQAALAIQQSQQNERIGRALVDGLRQLAAGDAALQASPLAAALDQAGEAALPDDLAALADRFNAISRLGESERRACLQILDAFAGYARSRSRFIP